MFLDASKLYLETICGTEICKQISCVQIPKSLQRELNPRPLVYKTNALPLSYGGISSKQKQALKSLR